jgi:lysophospholipase L1-like esterase
MRIFILTYIFLIQFFPGFSQTIKVSEPVHFLALGDSYTIGQSVGIDERWPDQFAVKLEQLGYDVDEVRIIAQTGWTTASLKNAINQQMPLEGYSLVSLLIGVNNQYQGGSLDLYTSQFTELLEQAIALAGDNPEHVFVLSIPDYAYTPFGDGNPEISMEIDQFNNANRYITGTYNVRYIDITPISRLGLTYPYLVASDGLHPSGDMYRLWVEEIIKHVEKELGVSDELTFSSKLKLALQGNELLIRSPIPFDQYQIFDLAGKPVASGFIRPAAEARVSLPNLPAGIYLVKIRTTDQGVLNGKFVMS